MRALSHQLHYEGTEMNFSRRAFLVPIVLGVIATACTPVPAPTPLTFAPTKIASDVSLISLGLAPVIAAMGTIPGVNKKALAQAQGYMKQLQTFAATFASEVTNPSPTDVQAVVTLVQAIAAIAVMVPAVAPYAAVIQAAVSLLPGLLALAGVSSDLKGVVPPDSARALLMLSAAGGGL
jgi:hypothetical protein